MEKYWLDNDLRPAFEYSRAITARFAKSFFMSAKLLPLERQWATFALYGFCRYADNLIDLPRSRSREQLLDEISHLGQELRIAYQTGESEHPILKAYICIAQRFAIPVEYPLDLLRGLEMDIQFEGYDTFDDLYVFCYRVAGVVGLMMTHILGYRDAAAFLPAEKLGVAMQLTNILRDIQEDKNMGRIYLPRRELAAFQVAEQDFYSERTSSDLLALIRFQAERAKHFYDEADRGIPLLDKKSQFAIYSASRIYRGILHKIEQAGYNPFLGRAFLSNHHKLMILLHEWLRR